MQRLKLNFNYLFTTLTLSQKIQIYLIPLLIIFLIFSNDLFSFHEEPSHLIPTAEKPIQTKISKIEILAFYEKIAKLTNSTIYTLQFDKKNEIKVQFGGDINCIINFLQEIEKRDKLFSFKMNQKDFNITIEAIFLVQTYHNTIITPIPFHSQLTNPFLDVLTTKSTHLPNKQQDKKIIQPKIQDTQVNKKRFAENQLQTNLEHIQQEEMKIEENDNYIEILPKSKTIARVGEYVLLNKEWLKIGDSYKGYYITKISNQTIHFEKDGKLAMMEMFNDN